MTPEHSIFIYVVIGFALTLFNVHFLNNHRTKPFTDVLQPIKRFGTDDRWDDNFGPDLASAFFMLFLWPIGIFKWCIWFIITHTGGS